MYPSETHTNSAAYSSIASIYDEWMADFDYNSILALLDECGIKPRTKVLDACCGTGRLTELLSTSGATIVGIDRSPEMLSVATERLKGKPNVEFRLADLREDLLLTNVELVTCTLDSINYLEIGDLQLILSRFSSYLCRGGALLFDMNTPYKLKEVFGNTIYADTRQEFAYIWKNKLSANHIDFEIDIFKRQNSGLYSRSAETHRQFFYSEEIVLEQLSRNGFSETMVFDGYSKKSTHPTTQRTVFLSRK
ncbi:class I SAM-dependent methyltransferase (plasmid) [Agrobacterium tumefaciens]|uniref:Class I SAM-dependent methyltransferase n=1 Tax=Agrobacterium tumefaciens TaxID=358 RepID=A0AAE6BJ74_AGRTU|nr:class I SAM-dependent methyltransferase [Agrobacterium tumefaciens]QCL82903.1 class I SAM-dependent methyltransferase [Agrobacterium tumefaciens]